jgi:hypothetical protein
VFMTGNATPAALYDREILSLCQLNFEGFLSSFHHF